MLCFLFLLFYCFLYFFPIISQSTFSCLVTERELFNRICFAMENISVCLYAKLVDKAFKLKWKLILQGMVFENSE